MKKKISPYIISGLLLNVVATSLNPIMANNNFPHVWITIPLHLLATFLIIFGIAKSRKK